MARRLGERLDGVILISAVAAMVANALCGTAVIVGGVLRVAGVM
jgi:hypothetical protein